MKTFSIACCLLLCWVLAACSSKSQPVPVALESSLTRLEVSAAKRWQDGGEHAVLNVRVNRAGLAGVVRVTLEGLPKGLQANPVLLAADQSEVKLEITGNPACLDTNMTVTIHAQAGDQVVAQAFDLETLRPKITPKGGTATASFSTPASSPFAATSVYANLAISQCQVMLQSAGRSVYVCFNGPIQPGTYSLGVARGVDAPGTVSMTYLETPYCGKTNRPMFFDSASGAIEVTEVSAQAIRFSVQNARMVPAQGFGSNPATGEFVMEANVTVNDIVQGP